MGISMRFQTICHNLLKDLPTKQKEIILRRFGLKPAGSRQTLEAIGQNYGITRERVRQIEEEALRGLAEKVAGPDCRDTFQYFVKYFKNQSSLKREDLLLADLGGQKFQNHIFFLLVLGNGFHRVQESDNLYAFWTVDKKSFNKAERLIDSFTAKLEKEGRPLSLSSGLPLSFAEISKNILREPQGSLYGLKEWPEINPRGVKDRAYLAVKKESRPLHFAQVAHLMGRGVLAQTVHNELIKDDRFVLVGRGLYALTEWGFQPGIVREVIAKVIEKSSQPLEKDKIIKEVLKQRLVQPNTILLNLQNQQYFIKNSQGKYTIRKV